MKISVVTVCYNSEATIADTLASIAAQTHRDVELIVVDGNSRDNTVSIVQRHGVSRLISEPDRGIYDAMNKGLAVATGDVVGFLNSDDVFADPDALARVAAAFEDPEIDLVYGDIVFVDREDTSKVIRVWTSRAYRKGLCATGWMPPHPTLYARRSVYLKHGNYDTDFPAAADFEMALRLLDMNHVRSKYLRHLQVKMRMGGQSTRSLRNIISGGREVSNACRKHGLPGGAWFAFRRVVAKIPQLFKRIDAA